MTKEDVIESLKYIKYINDYSRCREGIALDMVIEMPEGVKDKKGYWTGYDGQYCSVCKLPWNYYMTMNGDDIGYFDPMPKFCPNCGAKMRSDEE